MTKKLLFIMIAAAAVSLTYAETIGYWPFEENSGQFANCPPALAGALPFRLGSSGSTWQDPEWSADGYLGNCLHFMSAAGRPDGELDLIRPEPGTDVSMYNTDTFTVEAWIKLDSIPENTFDYYNPYQIVCFGGVDSESANMYAYFLRVTQRSEGVGMLNGYFYSSDGTGYSFIHSADLLVGEWYHVAFAVDGSSTTDNVSIWVNGAEEVNSAAASPRTDLAITGESLTVGSNWLRQRGFNGYIDELRISDTRLNTSELMINGGSVNIPQPQRETLAWWRFEEQAGQIAHCEPGMSDISMRVGTSDSDWHDCDWVEEGISGGGVMCYSDIDTGTLGYLTVDAADEGKVPTLMTESFTVEAWIWPQYIPLLNQAGTGAEFGFYDPFSIFDIKEWSSEATVTGDNSMFCLIRFMPNETGEFGRLEAAWYDDDTMRTILHNSTDIPQQEWTHVAFAYDATKAYDNATLYVNGVGTSFSTSRLPRTDQILPKLTIGGMWAGNYVKRGFWGMIDEVRITNKALTSQELLLPENPHGLDAVYLDGDINRDLYVDTADLALMAENWLAN
jgi:hypothetical protein